MKQIRCAICKRWFNSPRSNRKYCSPHCQKEAERRKNRALYLKKRKSLQPIKPYEGIEGKGRAVTDTTVYLIHKYYKEGMAKTEIARLLNRTGYCVEKALNTPLDASQKERMKKYLITGCRK